MMFPICWSERDPPDSFHHADIVVPWTPCLMMSSIWSSVVFVRNSWELSAGALTPAPFTPWQVAQFIPQISFPAAVFPELSWGPEPEHADDKQSEDRRETHETPAAAVTRLARGGPRRGRAPPRPPRPSGPRVDMPGRIASRVTM